MKKNSPIKAICRLPNSEALQQFTNPVQRITASTQSEVLDAVKDVETLASKGYYLVGYVAYEAATAFDSAMKTKSPAGNLVDFMAFESCEQFAPFSCQSYLTVKPEISESQYAEDINRVLQHIYDGDIYQANYTFRLDVSKIENPLALFNQLVSSHHVPYPVFLDFGDEQIISISPELFLEKNGDKLFSAPMKGTAARSFNYLEDRKIAQDLAKDTKNRAENLMIVDMVRNDLGRIAEFGSVKVNPLFHVDTYKTVHQMISIVECKTSHSFSEIMTTNFPAASITGAPKIKAMEIISQLEHSPRHVYCGTAGVLTPTGDFCLNVPIRTITVNKNSSKLGLGSGVVADSEKKAEWQECLLKGEFVNSQPEEFDIFETLSWTAESGYSDLEQHLERLENSQRWFGRPVKNWYAGLKNSYDKPQRIKFSVDKDGNFSELATAVDAPIVWGENVRVKISDKRTDSSNKFFYHKTTKRELYTAEFLAAKEQGFDEVLFFNQKGELTEGAISNIFIKLKDGWHTPALRCGLLPGIERAKLIKELDAKEAILSCEDLQDAKEIIICNSLRGRAKIHTITA